LSKRQAATVLVKGDIAAIMELIFNSLQPLAGWLTYPPGRFPSPIEPEIGSTEVEMVAFVPIDY